MQSTERTSLACFASFVNSRTLFKNAPLLRFLVTGLSLLPPHPLLPPLPLLPPPPLLPPLHSFLPLIALVAVGVNGVSAAVTHVTGVGAAAVIAAAGNRYKIDLSLPELPPEVLKSENPPRELALRVAYFVAKGNSVTARREVAESAQANQPEGLRLRCILALQSGDAAGAWSAMEAYLRETKRGSLP